MRALHRLALLAYPRAFRRQFGAELQRIFDERCASARRRSWFRGWATALFLVLDAAVSGMGERFRRDGYEGADAPRTRTMTWDSIWRDIAFASRQLRRAPLFAALTIASMAIGIGANTAIFAVVRAVLLQPLPYQQPDRLVAIWSDNTKGAEPLNPVSPANFEAFRAAPSLSAVEGMYAFLTPVQVRVGGEPEPALVSQVTPGMLSLLGRAPLIGRTFDERDTTDGAVLSYTFWQRRFGGDPSVIGRTVSVPGAGAGGQFPVIGVMPPDFTFPYGSMLPSAGFTGSLAVDMWWPMSRARDPRLVDASGQPNRGIHYFAVIGRLAPGASIDRARADLKAIAERRTAEFPDTNAGWGVTVRSLHEQTVGGLRPALMILLAGVGVVLLITCINVANVLLARTAECGRDLAIRSALGASSGRLVQQALTESVMLSVLGGIAGLGVMWLTLRGALLLAPSHLPRIGEVSPTWPVFAFAAAVSLLAGVAVGIIPALSAARSQAQASLRDGTRTTPSRARRRTRAALIVAEIALAMVLAVAAGLLFRSFVFVLHVDPGFNPDRLLTMQIEVPERHTTPSAMLAFYDELEGRLRALPGVTNVGGTTRLPLGSTNVTTFLEIEGRPVPRGELPEVEMRRALFDYFGTMQIPIRRGRGFTRDDHMDTPRVAVVNDALAARLFPGEDPVGRRVRFGYPNAPWMTVVGVVGDVRHGSLEEVPRPEIYISHRQNPPMVPFLTVRSASDPAYLATTIRQVFRDVGADPPRDVRTMESLRSGSLAARRFLLLLVGVFGVLSLGLAALGVFGVVTLITAERKTEVGIRLALGAKRSEVLGMLLREAGGLALAGISIGLLVAVLISPLIETQLFRVRALDPVTYGFVVVVLMVTALGGAFWPARRATGVDPASALRA